MKSLRKWEITLLLALCFTLLAGTWAGAASSRVSEGLVRLHVIAASDDATEQAIKLDVRDAVLSYLEPKLDSAADIAGAEALIEANIDGIAAAAESAAQGREVNVTLGEEYYPTREYDTFSLPAGRYQSLRVTLGEGAGHNWWCVVFPPLCTTAAAGDMEEAARDAGLSEDDVALITRSDEGYTLKFKSIELWEQWTAGWKK